MKIILKNDRRYILRFDKGEEVFENLKKFLIEQNIQASYFSGIGACGLAELAFYNSETKNYLKREFKEEFELLSFTGNSAVLNNEITLHAHAVLGKRDFTTIGGHVFKLVISATCEIFLIKLDGKMERVLDEQTDLNLLS